MTTKYQQFARCPTDAGQGSLNGCTSSPIAANYVATSTNGCNKRRAVTKASSPVRCHCVSVVTTYACVSQHLVAPRHVQIGTHEVIVLACLHFRSGESFCAYTGTA